MCGMARTFGLTCAKTFLFIYNVFFLVSGMVFLSGGIWLHVDAGIMSLLKIVERAHASPHLEIMSGLMMGVGTAVVLLAFIGCCGACCENSMMLAVYACVLLVVVLAELTCGTLAAVFRHNIAYYLEAALQEQIRLQYNRSLNTTDFLTRTWDKLQVDMDCCGSKGPQDYRDSNWFNITQNQGLLTPHTVNGNYVPATCCYLSNHDPDHPITLNDNQCQIDAILFPESIPESSFLKTKGCHLRLREWFHHNGSPFIGVGCVIGSLQLLGLFFAGCLVASLKRERTKFPWYEDEYTRGEHSYRFITANLAVKARSSVAREESSSLTMPQINQEERVVDND